MVYHMKSSTLRLRVLFFYSNVQTGRVVRILCPQVMQRLDRQPPVGIIVIIECVHGRSDGKNMPSEWKDSLFSTVYRKICIYWDGSECDRRRYGRRIFRRIYRLPAIMAECTTWSLFSSTASTVCHIRLSFV